MGVVDANASSLSPTPVIEHQKPVSTEYHKPTLSEKIKNIFNKPNKSPHDILTEFANLNSSKNQTASQPEPTIDNLSEIYIDNSSQPKEEIVTVNPQTETPPVDKAALKQEDAQQTAQYIKEVTEIIQQESTPKVEAVIETLKTLFPDSPPLYDKHHKAYDKEKKTIKGALIRSGDINQLQRDYLKNMSKNDRSYHMLDPKEFKGKVVDFYDSLRSRGIPRAQIMERDYDRRLKINKKMSPNKNYSTGIQRLDSLGLLSQDFLISDKKNIDTTEKVKKMAELSEKTFQGFKDNLNQYSFLSGQDIIPFMDSHFNDYNKAVVFQALSSIQKEFFSTPENQQKFTDYLNQHPELGDNIFGFVFNSVSTHKDPFIKMSSFVATLIDSGVNYGQRINIPQECLSAHADYHHDHEDLWYLDLKTRDQQRFILEKLKTYRPEGLKKVYFDSQGEATVDFYKDNIVYVYGLEDDLRRDYNTDQTRDLSIDSFKRFLLESSFPQEDQLFYHGIAKLKIFQNDQFPPLLANKDILKKYFKPDLPLGSDFFKELITNPEIRNNESFIRLFLANNLTPDIFQNFSPEDQKFWQNIAKNQDLIYYHLFSDDSYLNSEGLPTNEFLQSCFYNNDIHISNKFESITSVLTTEYIENLSPEGQNFWSNIQRLTESDRNPAGMFFFLSLDKSNFNSNGDIASDFFKNYCAQRGRRLDIDILRFNLSPDVLQNFSPEDQKFWQNIIKIDGISPEDIGFFIANSDNLNSFFNENGQPQSPFFEILAKSGKLYILRSNLSPDVLQNFSPEDQKFWQNILSLEDMNDDIIKSLFKNDFYLTPEGKLTSFFFKNEVIKINKEYDNKYFIRANLTPEIIQSFSSEDQRLWNSILNLKELNLGAIGIVLEEDISVDELFNPDGQPKSRFFEILAKNGMYDSFSYSSNLTPEVFSTFSSEDQELFNFIEKLEVKNKSIIAEMIFSNKDKVGEYINNNSFTSLFYQDFASQYSLQFVNSFDKEAWRLAFGNDVVDDLLNALPKSTNEKRNAFTHNEYDRTSEFFQFLTKDENSGFILDSDHIKIATDYIKNYGLSKSILFYDYFQKISLYEQGLIDLPTNIKESGIFSREDLKREIRDVQKKCFGAKPLTDTNDLDPFQINLLSIATGHGSNRWTRIPIERITSDFSRDLKDGNISPLPPEFYPESISSSSVKVETKQKISDNKNLVLIKEEILSSINERKDISSEKTDLLNMLNPRVTNLSEKLSGIAEGKRQFIQQQITAHEQQINLISSSESIDQLLSNLIVFNINLGETQDQFNSVLRRLVFKKVFLKHQGSPHWQEDIKSSLENEDTVSAVNNVLNLLNNTIKDHALNFESKNQDGYWDESTFEAMKKYSSVFKKNLSLSTFVNELKTVQNNFIVTQLEVNQNIELIPDRGLIGEMSGYMADVCYTKVYPLLKQYPDLVPYKFVSNPESESPEFIGSTLVFKVEDTDDQPVFLIRAFDIPQEQSINIGNFFEAFVDHLAPIAKKMGVKKIITAGTAGTVSNYSATTNYVISKYVKDHENVPLKNTFNFNGYNITNQCYLVRDIS